ncbi:hypothetical protein [Streptomyces sp. NPDC059009]|uniref:hypothetical protein n=1 Tax=Streptomyces sp. NPDC059009 TaxID=3346694 RepID=UPI0036C7303C
MPQLHHPAGDCGDSPWLASAVIDVVRRYCNTNEHVLVLGEEPIESLREPTRGLPTVVESASGLVGTLAVCTVVPEQRLAHLGDDPTARQESASGPCTSLPAPRAVALRTAAVRKDTGTAKALPDRFDTAIACVDLRSSNWIDDIAWGALLAPSGLLAFITYCHVRESGTSDFSVRVASIAHRSGLVPFDQRDLRVAPEEIHARLLLLIRPLPAATDPG